MLSFKDFLTEYYARENGKEYYIISTCINRGETDKINEFFEVYDELVRQGRYRTNFEKTKNKEFFKENNLDKVLFTDKVAHALKPDDFHSSSEENGSIAYIFKLHDYAKRLGIPQIKGTKYLYIKIKLAYTLVKRIKPDGTHGRKKYGITLKTSDEQQLIVDINRCIVAFLSIHD